MNMSKFKQILVVLILFSIISCKTENKNSKENITESSFEKSLKKELLKGFYTQINEDIGLLLFQNNIYYFNTSLNGFSNNKFLLHLIKQDNSFEAFDFFKDKYTVEDSLTPNFSNLEIIHRQVNFENYRGVRTGQFKRNPDGSTSNLWAKQVSIDDIFDKKESYKNQLKEEIGLNLLNENFLLALNHDVFFKNDFDFYILLNDLEIFLITAGNKNLDSKIMLHLVRQDNSFKNLSFDFRDKEYQMYLEEPFKELKIAKVDLTSDDTFSQIRIGQFNSGGNIWTQQFKIDDVFSNELLRYNGEFENR